MKHLTAAWAVLASASQVHKQDSTPLDYRGKFYGSARRYFITDSDAPPWKIYKGKPVKGNFQDSPDDVVAFLDVFVTKQVVYIAFMETRDRFTNEGGVDYTRKGLASRLVAALYADFPDRDIDWGELMDPGAVRLYDKYRDSHPEHTTGGSYR